MADFVNIPWENVEKVLIDAGFINSRDKIVDVIVDRDQRYLEFRVMDKD